MFRSVLFLLDYLAKKLAISQTARKESFSDNESFLENKKCFVRWGDGESMLLLGRDTYFQNSGIYISYCLLLLIANNVNGNILFPSMEKMKSRRAFNSTLSILNVINMFGGRECGYDALKFREEKINIDDFIGLLPNHTTIMCSQELDLSNLESRASDKGKTLKIIRLQERNAFGKANLRMLEKESKETELIIAACGPVGKIIITKARLRNQRFWDLGHGLNVILNNQEMLK